jgi:hypothetical protein
MKGTPGFYKILPNAQAIDFSWENIAFVERLECFSAAK